MCHKYYGECMTRYTTFLYVLLTCTWNLTLWIFFFQNLQEQAGSSSTTAFPCLETGKILQNKYTEALWISLALLGGSLNKSSTHMYPWNFESLLVGPSLLITCRLHICGLVLLSWFSHSIGEVLYFPFVYCDVFEYLYVFCLSYVLHGIDSRLELSRPLSMNCSSLLSLCYRQTPSDIVHYIEVYNIEHLWVDSFGGSEHPLFFCLFLS